MMKNCRLFSCARLLVSIHFLSQTSLSRWTFCTQDHYNYKGTMSHGFVWLCNCWLEKCLALAFVSHQKVFYKMPNLSHQRLKSKQELFSIFLGIFVFVTLELLFQRWIPGFSFETFGYLGFRQINLNNFSLCSQLWDTSTTEKTRTNLDWKLFVFNYHVRFKDIKLFLN